MKRLVILLISALIMASCGTGGEKKTSSGKTPETMEKNYKVRLMTVDPGHFHAALVQNTMYPQVSPDVNVYAPDGPDLQQHLGRINSYNTRAADPTSWNEIVYKGNDFFEKMLS
jgi:PBP1b-binding outer membrane lipoprotein LpoB